MTKESVSRYTMQIAQANASQLLCIAYSLWQEFAEDAMTAYQAGEIDEFKLQIKKLQRVNQEIISMLNHDNPCARDVMAFHFFANRKLAESLLKQKPVDVDRVKEMAAKLQMSFMELSKNDMDAPIMENTQQVYAGLTYGKGVLNESTDPLGKAGRGFLV